MYRWESSIALLCDLFVLSCLCLGEDLTKVLSLNAAPNKFTPVSLAEARMTMSECTFSALHKAAM